MKAFSTLTRTLPRTVRTFRGTIVDSDSLVIGAVVQKDGKITETFGSPEFRMSPRSTFKPFQALPYILSGAYADEGKKLDRLALACSSHLGEDFHVEILEPWMKEKNLTESDLACGPQTGRGPSRLRNNCSGKHLGLLSASQKMGFPLKDYNQEDKDLQILIRKILKDFFGEDFKLNARGTDGCSLPVYDCQIQNLAQAWLQLLEPKNSEYASKYKEACQEIVKAMSLHPYLVEGSNTLTSEIIRESEGDVIVKGGAAGVYTGVCQSRQLGFAFKCVDGQMDPTREILLDFLSRNQLLSKEKIQRVYERTFGPPHNWAGETTGHREILA